MLIFLSSSSSRRTLYLFPLLSCVYVHHHSRTLVCFSADIMHASRLDPYSSISTHARTHVYVCTAGRSRYLHVRDIYVHTSDTSEGERTAGYETACSNRWRLLMLAKIRREKHRDRASRLTVDDGFQRTARSSLLPRALPPTLYSVRARRTEI